MLKKEDTAIVLVDVQGKLAHIIHESEAMLENIRMLLQGANVLGVPVIWLEQYPKGLGPTTASVKELMQKDNHPIEKMTFSASDNEQFQKRLQEVGAENYLLAGIEAHVCVYQTARGLIERGSYIEIVQDAVSSRTLENKQIALQKLTSMGAKVTSVEMALFELMETAEHPKFKIISDIIK